LLVFKSLYFPTKTGFHFWKANHRQYIMIFENKSD